MATQGHGRGGGRGGRSYQTHGPETGSPSSAAKSSDKPCPPITLHTRLQQAVLEIQDWLGEYFEGAEVTALIYIDDRLLINRTNIIGEDRFVTYPFRRFDIDMLLDWSGQKTFGQLGHSIARKEMGVFNIQHLCISAIMQKTTSLPDGVTRSILRFLLRVECGPLPRPRIDLLLVEEKDVGREFDIAEAAKGNDPPAKGRKLTWRAGGPQRKPSESYIIRHGLLSSLEFTSLRESQQVEFDDLPH